MIYPAAFGSDHSYLVGSAVKSDIKHNEAIIFIPNKLLLTVERAKSSEIGHIFNNHDALFKANADRDFLILLVYMVYENQKGAESFWYPYFNAIDPVDITCYWGDQYLEALDDLELKENLISYKNDMDEDWDMILKIFKIYDDHFDLAKCTFEVYKRYSAFIATRCFGWGLPTTIIVPLADSFNHSS